MYPHSAASERRKQMHEREKETGGMGTRLDTSRNVQKISHSSWSQTSLTDFFHFPQTFLKQGTLAILGKYFHKISKPYVC